MSVTRLSVLPLAALLLAASSARATDVQPTVLQDGGGESTLFCSDGNYAIGDIASTDGSTLGAYVWDLRHPNATPAALAAHAGMSAGFSIGRGINGTRAVGFEQMTNSDGSTSARGAIWDLTRPHALPTVLSSGSYVTCEPLAFSLDTITGICFAADGTQDGVYWFASSPKKGPHSLGTNVEPLGATSGLIVGSEQNFDSQGNLNIAGAIWNPLLPKYPLFLNSSGTQNVLTATGRWAGGSDEATGSPVLWDLLHPQQPPRALADPAAGAIFGVDSSYAVGGNFATTQGFAVRIDNPSAASVNLVSSTDGAGSVAFGVDGSIAVGNANDANGVPHASFWQLGNSANCR